MNILVVYMKSYLMKYRKKPMLRTIAEQDVLLIFNIARSNISKKTIYGMYSDWQQENLMIFTNFRILILMGYLQE